jgi:aryl-alcohol dehydrogenase-like predicted oxidoreductase
VTGLAGTATVEGTRRGAESFAEGSRTLGRTGLTVSPVGFGGYRVRVDSPLHRRALADALRGGVNLVDTSTNYGDGRSEQLVGEVFGNLVQRGEIRREHVVVVSKAGYIQGSNLQRVQSRGTAYEDVVQMRDDLWHCIHPEFLLDQLEESRGRLGLQHIDVLLLHNPEYALADADRRGVQRAEAVETYEARLLRAFEALEEAVSKGTIGAYGMSSNGFVEGPGSARSNSLHRALELARRAGGDDHHFAVAQMPGNLFELGAAEVMFETPAGPRSPLQIAADADVGVLFNRPLNAFVAAGGRSRLVRLADPGRDEVTEARAEVVTTLGRVRKLEAQWATGLGSRLRTEDGSDDAVDLFRWGQELSTALPEIRDLARWQVMRHEVIGPHLGKTSGALLSALQGEDRAEFAAWWGRYGTAMHEAFSAIEAELRQQRRSVADAVAEALDPHLPEPWRSLPLSQKAVLSLLALPVSCVLVGMRHPGYVHDIASLREHPIRLLSAAAGPVDHAAVSASLARISAGLESSCARTERA